MGSPLPGSEFRDLRIHWIAECADGVRSGNGVRSGIRSIYEHALQPEIVLAPVGRAKMNGLHPRTESAYNAEGCESDVR